MALFPVSPNDRTKLRFGDSVLLNRKRLAVLFDDNDASFHNCLPVIKLFHDARIAAPGSGKMPPGLCYAGGDSAITGSSVIMKIAIGSDHAGFEYKARLLALLAYLGHEALDYGAYSEETTDYPRWIRPVAEAVARGEVDRGIVLGGSGNGEAIVANRVPGVRCTLCWNAESARYGRRHNDSNMLSMGQRLVAWETAREIVDVWLTTEFEGGRHGRRIRQIDG